MGDTARTFVEEMQSGYTVKGGHILLGAAMLEGKALPEAPVKIPLATLNRHGLIAGATGTGKTKTLELIAGELSRESVPVLLMDMKGDLSGLAAMGAENEAIRERHEKIGVPFTPEAFPVEFLSLSGEKGVRLRATVSEYGPVLLSRILGLNDTQGGIVSILFKYCDDRAIPLLDLKDLKKTLQYAGSEGKKEFEEAYGKLSSTSSGIILRKIVELEQQGGDLFFGEKSFEVDDLQRTDEKGRGVISVLRLTDIQERPKLFSTFMLCLLAEIYSTFPEEGDLSQPKLAIFIDEAHLLFEEASSQLSEEINRIIKLVRSKGVGVFFCTQNPADIPSSVLSQLGLKIQHALRAFTAQDRKAIKLAAENYPLSSFYRTDELLTALGIGEALVTALNEKGAPTPLAACLLRSPSSRMGILSPQEIEALVARSPLVKKYGETIDRESAYELLTAKIEEARSREEAEEERKKPSSSKKAHEETIMDNPLVKDVSRSFTRTIGTTVARELTRGILGVLGLGGRSRRSR
ncbi:MAG: DUF853 family protein [Candidatus Eremiobacteraeota bacterium]|nr:DUF853 family protein [Candidatus Eremiobacteraeota bacterium]